VGVLVLSALLALAVPVVRWIAFSIVLLLLAVRRPVWALALLPLTVAFGSLFQLTWDTVHVGPTDALLGALIVSWLLHTSSDLCQPSLTSTLRGRVAAAAARACSWLARRWHANVLPVFTFVVLAVYLLVIAASSLVATARAAVGKEAVKWAEVTLVVALVLWLARSPVVVRGLVWALIAAGVAEALLGCIQWILATGDLGPGGASVRVFGTFAQPNPYAGFLNFALLPALAIALWGTEPRERWGAYGATVLLADAAWLAGSRGAMLGLAVGVVLVLAIGLRKERQVGLAALVGVPLIALAWALGLIPPTVLAKLRLSGVSLDGPVNINNFSDIERLAHWVAGLRMFAAHPLLGVGAGNYDAAYARYAVPGWPDPLGHAHDYYINAAAETGLLGLLTFLALIAVTLVTAWQAVHTQRMQVLSPQPPAQQEKRELARGTHRLRLLAAYIRWQCNSLERAWGRERNTDLALGLLAAIVAVLIHSLTDDLFVHAVELTFGLVVGLLVVLSKPTPQPLPL
jgi:O-antigen ligase